MVTLGLLIISGSFLFYRYKLGRPLSGNREYWQFAGHAIVFLGSLYNLFAIYLFHG